MGKCFAIFPCENVLLIKYLTDYWLAPLFACQLPLCSISLILIQMTHIYSFSLNWILSAPRSKKNWVKLINRDGLLHLFHNFIITDREFDQSTWQFFFDLLSHPMWFFLRLSPKIKLKQFRIGLILLTNNTMQNRNINPIKLLNAPLRYTPYIVPPF